MKTKVAVQEKPTSNNPNLRSLLEGKNEIKKKKNNQTNYMASKIVGVLATWIHKAWRSSDAANSFQKYGDYTYKQSKLADR